MSLVLNGSSQYAYRAAPIVSIAPFTVAGWFKSTSNSTLQAIWGCSHREDTDRYWRLAAHGNAAGDPVGTTVRGGGGTSNAVTTTGYMVGSWHHAMLVETSSSNRSVYIDGGSIGSDTVLATPTSLNYTGVGVLPYSSSWVNYFAGKLARIAVWDIALGSSDRAALAGGADPATIQSAHLIAYWPLYDDTNDDTGSGFDLTTAGSPTFDTADNPPAEVALSGLGGLFTPERLEDCPEPKEQHGFEGCGGKLYAVCGITTGAVYSKTTYMFDPSTGHWTKMADAPRTLQSPILRSVGGKLYLMGGYRSDLGVHYDNVSEYDPGTDSWSEKTPMPQGLEDFGSAVIDGKIWIFGGLYQNDPSYLLRQFIDVFDPATNTWASPSIAWATPRCLGDYCCSYNGKIYVISATADMSGYSGAMNATKDVERWDPVLKTFTKMADCILDMVYKEAEAVEGIIYTVSGTSETTIDYQDLTQVYDIALNKWKSMPAQAYAARGVGMTQYNGIVYFNGGFNGSFLNYLYRVVPMTRGSGSGTLTQDVAPPTPPAVVGSRYNAFNRQIDQDRS